MDRLQHHRLEKGRHLNVFVAAGICIADGSLLGMCRSLHAAASALAVDGCATFIDELGSLPPGSAVSQEARSSACFDEAAVERLCREYLKKLNFPKFGADRSFDPVQIADLLLNRLLSEEPWRGDATLYAYNWKIARTYKLNGWHILAPLIIAFNLGLPDLASLRELKRSLDQISRRTSPVTAARLLKSSGLDDFAGGRRLLESFVINRWDVVASSASFEEVRSTRGAALCLELLARHGRDHKWFRTSGITMTSDEAPAVEFDYSGTCGFLAHHRVEVRGRFGCEQMVVKALLRRCAPERFEQGLSECLYKAIVDLLVERQEVVSIARVRQYCGLQTLRISPFAILPGRLLVYAPSPRFLEPSAVTFVLREWVQDSAHSKGRIAPDRVLTPLEQIRWGFSAADLITTIRSSRSFQLFGVAFWPEIRRPLIATLAVQARRWAIYHLDRQSLHVLRANGLYRVANMILDEASWGDLSRVSRANAIVASTISDAQDVASHEREAVIELLRAYSSYPDAHRWGDA